MEHVAIFDRRALTIKGRTQDLHAYQYAVGNTQAAEFRFGVVAVYVPHKPSRPLASSPKQADSMRGPVQPIAAPANACNRASTSASRASKAAFWAGVGTATPSSPIPASVASVAR